MRIFAISLLVLAVAGMLVLVLDGFAPGSNLFHLFALVLSGLMVISGGLLLKIPPQWRVWRAVLVAVSCLVLVLWAVVGYRCYRISLMPAENEQTAGDALDRSGLYQ